MWRSFREHREVGFGASALPHSGLRDFDMWFGKIVLDTTRSPSMWNRGFGRLTRGPEQTTLALRGS